jgi:Xaa-Pro dipeptidase
MTPTPTNPRRPRGYGPLGTAATEDGAGVDYAALRAQRRQRVIEAMDEADIDALVLGRYPNIKYVVGHRSLWRAVLTPWAPVCVLVRRTGQVSLQASTWEDGMPPEVPTENLTGLTWNPRHVVEGLQRVEGLADSRRVGVDGVSPSGMALMGLLFPQAEIVDGQRLLDGVRRVRLPSEVHCVRTALAIAEGAVAATLPAVVAGAGEDALKGQLVEELLHFSPVLVASEPLVCATPTEADDGKSRGAQAPLRLRPSGRALHGGDLVALRAEVLYSGYLGSVMRTVAVPTAPGAAGDVPGALRQRWRRAVSAVVEMCRPGAAVGELLDAWDSSGEARPPVPVVFGVGLGMEAPVAGNAFGPEGARPDVLEAGMILCVQGYVWERGVGGYLASETVLVDEGGPTLLTRLPGGLGTQD